MSRPLLQTILFPGKDEALAAWASMVRENRDQAERFRELPEQPDFYAPTANIFKANPNQVEEPAIAILRSLVSPGETWLDIGAGGGRNSLPLARTAGGVIAVEPSSGMLANLRQSMNSSAINNIRIIQERWPLKQKVEADVALISHVGYDIENIGPFLEAMEGSARRLCVAVFLEAAPSSAAAGFWLPVHGEARSPLPALPQFLILQIARGRLFEMRLTTRHALFQATREIRLSFLRQQLFNRPEGDKDRLLQKLLEQPSAEPVGVSTPSVVGVVTWQPR